jgi:hypothetical protein
MNKYEIIKSKQWVNINTKEKASLFGAVPYINDSEKQNWVIKEFGWTIRNNKLNTVGIGRKPFVTYFEALNWIKGA